jgi:guanylate kinase
MTKGKAIIFSAPSGAGKTTIVRHLLGVEDLKLSFSISATTRAKRAHEIEGRDYYFISPQEFIERAREGHFVEWEEVYEGQYYGTLKSEIDRIWRNGKHVIFDLDVIGGLNLKKILGDQALAVFVKPPSIEILRFRLRNRSTETADKITIRLEKAHHELTFEPRFDKVIVNDILEDAFIQSEKLVRDFLKP